MATRARRYCHRQLGEWGPWVLITEWQPEVWRDIIVSDGHRAAMARDKIIPKEKIRYWMSIHQIPLLRMDKKEVIGEGCECG